jgi:HSP20 family protein
MALPNPLSDWTASEPVFGSGNAEMYEEDDEFVLTFEMPGFERDDTDLVWDEEGRRINVAAERVDEDRGRRRTYHRTFRAPKEVDPDGIEATYRNGVLELTSSPR